jgi:flagellar basal body rod protein FlgG
MISAFYASKSGAKNYQYYLDAVANNIANVNTNGYKTQNVNFTDLLYSERGGVQVGNGSKAVATRDMEQGGVLTDGASLNVMINGSGFLAVQDAGGNISYTRSGELSVGDVGGTDYLMTTSGDFVLDNNLNKIKIDDTQTSVTFRAPGEATGNEAGIVTLGIFSFADPSELTALGNGKYRIPENSGITATPDTYSTLVQNMAESSNVDLVTEMSKMIMAQRGFQINAQMIRTADEIEQTVNNLNN